MDEDTIRENTVYFGRGAVRQVVKITDVRPHAGSADLRDVLYTEIAGRNRSRTLSLSLAHFAAWADRPLDSVEIEPAIRSLGLGAWPLTPAEAQLVETLRKQEKSSITCDRDGEAAWRPAAEKLCARGLARRVKPAGEASGTAYWFSDDLLKAVAASPAQQITPAGQLTA